MLVFDTNVLVYAANKDSEFHLPCRRRLEEARRDPLPAFLTWSVCYEFLRVSTHHRALRSPWRPREAWRLVSELLASPGFDILVATERHPRHPQRRLSPSFPISAANLMHDLHTAVLMREHGIRRICTPRHRLPPFSVHHRRRPGALVSCPSSTSNVTWRPLIP